MRPLITLSARWAAVATGVVLAIGMAAGLVRLLPWLVAPDVPWLLAAPFARALAAGALEAALLVGLPTGVGIASAIFVERGEARALAAVGARPARVVAGLGAAGLLIVGASMLAEAIAGPEPPGRFADHLVSAGRAACAGSDRPGRVDVPLLSLTWLCFPSGPRVAGRIPGVAAPLWFSAAELRPGDELRGVAARDLHVAGRLAGRVLRMKAADARFVGLPSFRPSRLLDGAPRGLVISASALLVALAGAWCIVCRGAARPVASVAASGGGATAMLASVRALDSRSAPLLRYAAVPLVGVLVAVALFLLIERVARWRVARYRAE